MILLASMDVLFYAIYTINTEYHSTNKNTIIKMCCSVLLLPTISVRFNLLLQKIAPIRLEDENKRNNGE